MASNEPSLQTTQTIEDSLTSIRTDIPQLSGVVDAFQDLLINRAVAKTSLPEPGFSHKEVDPLRFSQGIPVLPNRKIIVERDAVRTISGLLIPSMKRGFPKLDVSLSKLESFLNNNAS